MIFSFEYDGKSYEFDDERMGLGEARWVKKETGLVGAAFFEAARKLDPDAIVAVLVMAMRRAGEINTKMDDIYSDDENGYYRLIESLNVKKSPDRAEVEVGPKPGIVKKTTSKG